MRVFCSGKVWKEYYTRFFDDFFAFFEAFFAFFAAFFFAAIELKNIFLNNVGDDRPLSV